ERGQHQLALLEVGALVEQDHRIPPDDGLEDPRALTWMENLRRSREDLADVLGVAEVDERRREGQANRVALPVAGPAALAECDRARPPAEHLQRGWIARAWRKGLRA